MEKIYHLPDWLKAEKSSSLTDYALCGQNTVGPQTEHWFAWGPNNVNCYECLKIRFEQIRQMGDKLSTSLANERRWIDKRLDEIEEVNSEE